ncbi:Ca2+-binding protein, RTX toxin-related [Halopseudomonas sabulinigri]|uniref:Ca2+-binding protein, RTX toxin-related n=2 Tax=Halopseudomonas sabulinigri TaxID=472181 RepID=A0A1H1LJT5_9GAMM|nr:Ca2+-binding protein, RTX toxin-related [Halopseudomonas sabulinigri]
MYTGQYRNGVSADASGIVVTDTKGYQAHIRPDGSVDFTDNSGNRLKITRGEATVGHSSGSSSVEVSNSGRVTLTAKVGGGEVKVVAQINSDGTLSVSEVRMHKTLLKVGNAILGVKAGVEMVWKPGEGWSVGKFGEEPIILGLELSEIAEIAASGVENSALGEMLSSTDDYIDDVLNGEFGAGSRLDWMKYRNSKIDPDVNKSFDYAMSATSPIVLDLDGDGIETIGANGSVLFDHDGDGHKHGTGWVESDDGLLALDVNGNGVIDSGKELFGEHTILNGGAKAENGFAAMQGIDSNSDGILDSGDAAWVDLRVWRDLNSDGVSDSGELFTLDELGVKSISTGSTGTRRSLGNGNYIDGDGGFDWESGVGSGPGRLADVYFENNNFYREFGDEVDIPLELMYLPDMTGSGAVRDLKQAAAVDSNLADILLNYSSVSSASEQKSLLDKLVSAWAESAEFRTFDERVSDLGIGKDYRVEFRYSWEIEVDAAGAGGGGGGGASSGVAGAGVSYAEGLKKKELLDMVKALEVFNGEYFFDFTPASTEENDSGEVGGAYRAGNQGRSFSGARVTDTGPFYVTERSFNFGPNQEREIRSAYSSLINSVYNGLLMQTRLQSYVDIVEIRAGQQPVEFEYDAVWERLEEVASINVENAFYDLVDLDKNQFFLGSANQAVVHERLLGFIQLLPEDALTEYQSLIGKIVVAGSVYDDEIIGGSDNEVIYAGGGADSVSGGAGDDAIYGDAGNDVLDGGNGSNHLYGGDGDDILRVAANANSDKNILAGGKGDDTLHGSLLSDTYLFDLGDGTDTIVEVKGTSYNHTDVLRFGVGINPDDIQLRRSGADLIFSHVNGTDSMTLQGAFSSETASAVLQTHTRIEAIEFEGGPSFTWTEFVAGRLAQHGTDAGDILFGHNGNDAIYAGAGNDVLDGGNGSNHLYGGDGDDILRVAANANSDKNILAGGKGDDTLHGSLLSDTYLFDLGDGTDTIVEVKGTSYNHTDVLRFGVGINPDDIQLRRSGADLIFSHVNGTDSMTLQGAFSSETASAVLQTHTRIEAIEFEGGPSFTWTEFVAGRLAQHGTDAGDILFGHNGNDAIYAGAGNDVLDGGNGSNHLYGGDGDDILRVAANANSDKNILAGGKGDDTLHGSLLSDTYLFDLGDGTDTIVEAEGRRYNHTDVLRFGVGINPDDIQLRRSGADLIFSHVNGTDSMTLQGAFSSETASAVLQTHTRIEAIEFEGGPSFTWTEFVAGRLAQHGTDAGDILFGHNGNDAIYAGAGNDVLDGGNGSNHLYGGDGDDILRVAANANSDKNILAGGKGDDTLHGSLLSDTYLFDLGDGTDTIVEAEGRRYNHTDVLRFGVGINPDDIQLRRSGADLIFSHVNGTDSMTLQGAFSSETASAVLQTHTRIEAIEFEGGPSFTWTEFVAGRLAQHGTDAGDILFGHNGNDAIYAGAGNDVLDGGNGSNHLYGGDGDDILRVAANANSDKNILAGGKGDDTLHGSLLSDTYLFDLGDGTDTIVEAEGRRYNHTDVLRFGEGVSADIVWFEREGSDLHVDLLGSNDGLVIKEWYGSTPKSVEQFQLADGRALHANQVDSLVSAMASFGVPAGGESSLTPVQREQLDIVIAASWQ